MLHTQLTLHGYTAPHGIDRIDTVPHYGLPAIPRGYIAEAPDFDAVAVQLRDYLRQQYPQRPVCIRGVSVDEHNAHNGTSLSRDELVAIIGDVGHDRYRNDVVGKGYDNVENAEIRLFAFDVHPCVDDDDLMWFFQSFYYYCIHERGVPAMLDLIVVYDVARLVNVPHRYEGRDDVKRDGYVFRDDGGHPRDTILEVIHIDRPNC